jgi:hypothetical protein
VTLAGLGVDGGDVVGDQRERPHGGTVPLVHPVNQIYGAGPCRGAATAHAG